MNSNEITQNALSLVSIEKHVAIHSKPDQEIRVLTTRVHGYPVRSDAEGQAVRLQNFFMLNSTEHEIYHAHKC